jgi:ribosomal protein S18 acetylase RimI-like enzyme
MKAETGHGRVGLHPAAEADFPGICELLGNKDEFFLIYPRGSWPFNVAQLQRLAAERKELTVARAGAAVIGFANLYGFEPGRRALIGNVVVAGSWRGRGVGRRMVAHMLELIFHKYALAEAHISVFAHNSPALLLYAGFGFRPYAVRRKIDFSGTKVALLHLKLPRADYIEER